MGQEFQPGVHPRPFRQMREEFTPAEQEQMMQQGWSFCPHCTFMHATSCTNSHNGLCPAQPLRPRQE